MRVVVPQVGDREDVLMVRSLSRLAPRLAVVAVLIAIAACGSPGGDRASAGGAAAPAGDPPPTADPPPAAVKTANKPDDACGWIPVAEVERIIGTLEGQPRAAGNECTYPLAEKSAAFTRMIELRRKMREIDGIKGRDGEDRDFDSLVRVTVDPKGGSIVGDLATAAVGKMFARELGQPSSAAAKKAAPPPGWDSASGMPYTWIGRVGHVSISVFSPPEITRERQIELAAHVRDRIPDLPFAAENTYQVLSLGGGDRNPCSLLTRAEAEAVLGPLVVDPYRAVEDTPFAYDKGKACAYFTPGHRAFIITPEWSDGASTFNIGGGIGALVGAVAPLEKAAIEGPWDKGRVDGMTGALMFLKGDRYLRVDYLTAAADRGGALKLAAQAMQRLGS